MQFDHDLDRILPSAASVDSVTIGGNAALNIPAGTAAQRPLAPVAGSLRFSTTATGLEYYTGAAWISFVPVAPGAPTNSVQYNNAGVFAGDADFLFTPGANPFVSILGTLGTNQLRIGGSTNIGTATVYIESDGSNNEGQRVYFNNAGNPAVSGFIGYAYDTATPYIKITDADDDPPYITFDTIGTGTYASPLYVSAFGARGGYGSRAAGNNSGFAWYVGANTNANALITAGVSAMELDSQFLLLPRGTTAQRPTGTNGMQRYNTTLGAQDFFQNGSWVQYVVLPQASINTVLAGPTIGSPATPTFRTLGLATNDLNDVTITSATTNQVLVYNGTRWVNGGAVGSNATGLVGVGQAGVAAWTLISGSTYRADFVHNLGTTNVVITVFDSSTLQLVIPGLVTCTNNNTVRVQVVGNTRTLKVVVVANGQSIVAGGSTPSSIIAAKDGVTVGTTTTRLNFTGQAVRVTDAGANQTDVNFGARYAYFANSLDSPNNADFIVNALAPVTTDPARTSLNVRSFSNTVEQGVGFTCSIPAGATQVTFKFRGRANTAPATASVVQPRVYHRRLPDNAVVGAWSAAQELSNISIPTNANFQYATQTFALSALGLAADSLYQFELTRRVTGVTGTNLASAFLLAEVTLEFA